MKKIVFEKLTVQEEKKVMAGDLPSSVACEPDTPGSECKVPTYGHTCSSKKLNVPRFKP